MVTSIERFSRSKYRPAQEISSVEFICDFVCKYFDVSKSDIIKKGRKPDIVKPRHIYCFMAAKHTRLSLKEIASLIKRDHTSVIHAISSVNDQRQTNEGYNEMIEDIEVKLQQAFKANGIR